MERPPRPMATRPDCTSSLIPNGSSTLIPGSSSTILSTLISLLSCLVTCSSGCSSQLTTIVMREISSCSVGPTARDSMLKPRRANRPATRTRTPGLFSTSTDSVCLVIGGTSPVGREAARELDVVVGRAARDHGPDHGVPVADEVDHARAVVDLHGPLDGLVDVAGFLAADALAAVGLGELDEVGDAGAGQLPRRADRRQAGVGRMKIGVGV